MVLFLGVLLVFVVVGLNFVFIPMYGINGAALATLIAIGMYSLAKLLFVVLKMNLFPFTKNTVVALFLALVSFGVFYYWDFSFHPFVNIVLKSILVTIFYLGLSYYFKVSSDINFVMNSVFKRIFKK
jgi:O-antigen/teichoic acid export membrane protein